MKPTNAVKEKKVISLYIIITIITVFTANLSTSINPKPHANV